MLNTVRTAVAVASMIAARAGGTFAQGLAEVEMILAVVAGEAEFDELAPRGSEVEDGTGLYWGEVYDMLGLEPAADTPY